MWAVHSDPERRGAWSAEDFYATGEDEVRAVMAALQRWAAERGARWVYLQVAADNAPARALYRRAGFIEHHRYHYRRRPG